MATDQIIKTNARLKVLEHAFGADSTDCRFQFIDDSNKSKRTQRKVKKLHSRTKEIAAHRNVLSAISPVFATMFNDIWSKNTNVIVIKDASYEAFDTFVKYFYEDTIKITAENVVDILTLADRYDVQDLVTHCESFILKQLSIDNVLKYFSIAVRFKRAELKAACERLFIEKTMIILQSKSFSACDITALTAFLRMVSESCLAEDMFDACIVWAETNVEENGKDKTSMDNLRAELGECFEFLRFKEMKLEAMADRYKKYKMLFTTDERDAILEHLLDNTGTRCYFQQSNNEMLKWIGKRLTGTNPSRSISFKLNKSSLLDGFTFGAATIEGSAVPFSVKITVKLDNVSIMHTADFTADNLSFTFPAKIFIDAGKVCTIEYDRSMIGTFNAFRYEFKRQKLRGVQLIPMNGDRIVDLMYWGGTEIRFIETLP